MERKKDKFETKRAAELEALEEEQNDPNKDKKIE